MLPSVLIKCQINSLRQYVWQKLLQKSKSKTNQSLFWTKTRKYFTLMNLLDIFNSQCECFLWLKFKFTEKTTNHKQNQVDPRHNINITIKRILQRYTMVKHTQHLFN